MAIEARPPPTQWVARLRRAVGGRSGWKGLALQLLFVAALIWIGYEIVDNARGNLANQRIASGFGFMSQTAGFGVSQALIPYSESDSYTRVFLVGLVNTLVVSAIGIVFATILGFVVGVVPAVAELAAGADRRRLCRTGPQPAAVCSRSCSGTSPCSAPCRSPRQSVSLFDAFFLSNRGIVVPKPVGEAGFDAFLIAVAIAFAAAIALPAFARRRLYQNRQAAQSVARRARPVDRAAAARAADLRPAVQLSKFLC